MRPCPFVHVENRRFLPQVLHAPSWYAMDCRVTACLLVLLLLQLLVKMGEFVQQNLLKKFLTVNRVKITCTKQGQGRRDRERMRMLMAPQTGQTVSNGA